MDRVYRSARRVCALFTRGTADVEALVKIDAYVAIRPFDNPFSDRHVADLFKAASTDAWHERAWTLQENLRSARSVDYLIPLASSAQRTQNLQYLKTTASDLCLSQTLLDDIGSANDPEWGPDYLGDVHRASRSLIEAAPTYRKEELDVQADLSTHRLSALQAFDLLSTRQLSIEIDVISIIANIASYTIRVDYERAVRQDVDLDLCIFLQALLNGDASLLLAWRWGQYLRLNMNNDDVDPLPRRSLPGCSLPGLLLASFRRDELRSRIAPPVLTPRGLQVKGYLWRPQTSISMPQLRASFAKDIPDHYAFAEIKEQMIRDAGIDCNEPPWDDDSINAAVFILRGVAREEGPSSSMLVFRAMTTVSNDPRMWRDKTDVVGHKLSDTKITFPEAARCIQSNTFMNGNDTADRMLANFFRAFFNTTFAPKGMGLKPMWSLSRLLSTAVIHVYSLEDGFTSFDQPLMFWIKGDGPTPRRIFTPSRVLLEGEHSFNHLLAWRTARALGESNQLEAEEFLPSKIWTVCSPEFKLPTGTKICKGYGEMSFRPELPGKEYVLTWPG